MIDARIPSDSHPQIFALIYHFAMRKSVSNRAANIGTLSVVVKCYFKRDPAFSLNMKWLPPLTPLISAAGAFH